MAKRALIKAKEEALAQRQTTKTDPVPVVVDQAEVAR